MPDKTDRDIDGLSPRERGKQTADKNREDRRLQTQNCCSNGSAMRFFLLNMNKC